MISWAPSFPMPMIAKEISPDRGTASRLTCTAACKALSTRSDRREEMVGWIRKGSGSLTSDAAMAMTSFQYSCRKARTPPAKPSSALAKAACMALIRWRFPHEWES